jgi:hypothetical protein
VHRPDRDGLLTLLGGRTASRAAHEAEPDARAIGDALAERGIKRSLGGQVYDPADPMGKMVFHILATFTPCLLAS